MGEPALKSYENVPVPRRVKVSSKRQITIPVDIYERRGFAKYALLTETPDGLLIQPLELADDDEELTVQLLRYLIDSGCEGDQLLEQYMELKPKFVSYCKAVERSEADIEAGNVVAFDDMQRALGEKHGL